MEEVIMVVGMVVDMEWAEDMVWEDMEWGEVMEWVWEECMEEE